MNAVQSDSCVSVSQLSIQVSSGAFGALLGPRQLHDLVELLSGLVDPQRVEKRSVGWHTNTPLSAAIVESVPTCRSADPGSVSGTTLCTRAVNSLASEASTIPVTQHCLCIFTKLNRSSSVISLKGYCTFALGS